MSGGGGRKEEKGVRRWKEGGKRRRSVTSEKKIGSYLLHQHLPDASISIFLIHHHRTQLVVADFRAQRLWFYLDAPDELAIAGPESCGLEWVEREKRTRDEGREGRERMKSHY